MKVLPMKPMIKSIAIASGIFGLLTAPVAAVALSNGQGGLRPLDMSAFQLSSTVNGNNGNHGSKSTDNSANCTKNNDNNAQNQGNCPGDVPASD